MAGSSHLSFKSSKGRQFKISLPNEEDEDSDVQHGGPNIVAHSSLLLSLKYQVVHNAKAVINASSKERRTPKITLLCGIVARNLSLQPR